MVELRIKIQDCPNAEVKVFHSRAPTTEALWAAVDKLNGVESVTCQRYSTQIVKAKMFTWDEVEQVVVPLLTQLINGGFKDEPVEGATR